MIETWVLFGVLTLTGGQLIYPDQYEKMTTNHGYPSALQPINYSINNNQPAEINQKFTGQFNTAKPIEEQFYPTTTVPQYSANSIANTPSSPETWSDHVSNIISGGITKFSLNLNRAIYKTSGTAANQKRENIIFSPLSVSVVLSLVLLGSAGKTFEEVSQILGLETGVDISQHSEIVHQIFGRLLAIMNYRVEGSNMPNVSLATGIFVQQGYPIRPEFRAISENAYKSEVINLDFHTKGREARDIINDWVKKKTMGKIDSILSETPDPLTTVILSSALYFKGEWNQHFIESMTRRKEFFVEPNNTVMVDMMYNGGNFPFYEDKSLGVKIIALPYKGLEMSMYVLLPKDEGATALKNFQDQLTAEIIERLIGNMKNVTCIVGFPRMKLSSTSTLSSALQDLGLHSLFDPKTADLSLLSNGQVQQTATPISQALPTSNSQTSPELLRKISPTSLQSPNTKTDEYLIFSRFGNNQSDVKNARRNYFAYSDKRYGLSVEQWSTGFNIRTIGRTRRNIRKRKQRNDIKSSRMEYVENDDQEKVRTNVDDMIMRYVPLEENKYRFQKNIRRKRQSRPIDENFLKFMESQNFPFYGVDNLRNSGNLVNPGLYASDVLHKVEMDITEKGTEAAATTAVLLRRDGNQKKLLANRPFMFFIRHDPTKLILFWGTINVPTPSYAVVR